MIGSRVILVLKVKLPRPPNSNFEKEWLNEIEASPEGDPNSLIVSRNLIGSSGSPIE